VAKESYHNIIETFNHFVAVFTSWEKDIEELCVYYLERSNCWRKLEVYN